jgi:hypothetical protein
MSTFAIDRAASGGLLRVALKLDALVTGANGAAYLIGAGALDSALGISAGTLRIIGAFLVLYGAAVWFVATRERISRAAAWTVVEANIAWAIASVVVVATDGFSPTTGGSVWIVLQALTVAGFAALQAFGLRKG